MPGQEISISPWVKADFIKRDKTVQLTLKSDYSHQYAASGKNTLIDGVQGTNEFRTGDYQGFWAQDVVAEVSFETPRVLKEIGISCLQDMKSWIFYPSQIEIEISYDGINFEKLPVITTIHPLASYFDSPTSIPNFSSYVGPTNKDFYQKTNSDKPILAFRLRAKNYGKCPEWHLGANSETWLFSDELIFR
jgi:hypothetical protein